MAIKKQREMRVNPVLAKGVFTLELQQRESGKVEWLVIDQFSIPVEKIPDGYIKGELVIPAKVYCLQKLLQERTSGFKESAKAKFAEMLRLWEEVFSQGQWQGEREAGSRADYTLVIIALYELALAKNPKATLPAVRQQFQSKTAEEKRAYAAKPEVVARVKELEEAEQGEGIDFLS